LKEKKFGNRSEKTLKQEKADLENNKNHFKDTEPVKE
jgi:hypothetical protein